MEGVYIWRECTYGGSVHMGGVYIWRECTYGGSVHMEGVYIWREGDVLALTIDPVG